MKFAEFEVLLKKVSRQKRKAFDAIYSDARFRASLDRFIEELDYRIFGACQRREAFVLVDGIIDFYTREVLRGLRMQRGPKKSPSSLSDKLRKLKSSHNGAPQEENVEDPASESSHEGKQEISASQEVELSADVKDAALPDATIKLPEPVESEDSQSSELQVKTRKKKESK